MKLNNEQHAGRAQGSIIQMLKSFLPTFDVNSFDVDMCLFGMQDVVSVQGEHERILYIQKVIKELPVPHFR